MDAQVWKVVFEKSLNRSSELPGDRAGGILGRVQSRSRTVGGPRGRFVEEQVE